MHEGASAARIDHNRKVTRCPKDPIVPIRNQVPGCFGDASLVSPAIALRIFESAWMLFIL